MNPLLHMVWESSMTTSCW
ncbi:rCG53529 [Rattus norvegicus]|uniref:RCG53529 n=1 Tax=Rattus norvegicus TaxID=10116 RepID=A6J9T8_RAT|nr:rCG53529 [Rattus norvegicus]